jgi:hypothetical protein
MVFGLVAQMVFKREVTHQIQRVVVEILPQIVLVELAQRVELADYQHHFR